tara:strand:+ start:5375 stop:6919 length:1545 start_codon:yes stop_codon:yes gene_type:complete
MNDNITFLDLDNLSENQLKDINKISSEILIDLINLKEIIQNNESFNFNVYGDFWNIDNNLIFDLSILTYIKKIKSKKIKVLCSDIYLFKSIKNNNITCDVIFKKKSNFKNNFFKDFISSIIKSFLGSIIWIISFCKRNKIINKKNILVDSFLLYSSFKNSKYIDRLYNGYKLPKNSIFLMTDLVNSKFLIKNFDLIYQNQRLIIHDFFCSPFTQIKVLVKYIILNFYKIKGSYQIGDLNIDHLIKKWHKQSKWRMSIYHSYKKYYVLKKLFNYQSVTRIIDWNENQNIDRSLNLISNEYKINVEAVRLFFGTPNEIQLYSTNYELENKLLPYKFMECSKFLNYYHQKVINKTFEIKIIPYNRSTFTKLSNKGKFIVLVLPNKLFKSLQILSSFSKLHLDNNILKVKAHPSLKDKLLKLYPNFKFISDKEINNIYNNTSLFITSESSFLIEGVHLGAEIICFAFKNDILRIPLQWAFKNIRIIYNAEEIFNTNKNNIKTSLLSEPYFKSKSAYIL